MQNYEIKVGFTELQARAVVKSIRHTTYKLFYASMFCQPQQKIMLQITTPLLLL